MKITLYNTDNYKEVEINLTCLPRIGELICYCWPSSDHQVNYVVDNVIHYPDEDGILIYVHQVK